MKVAWEKPFFDHIAKSDSPLFILPKFGCHLETE